MHSRRPLFASILGFVGFGTSFGAHTVAVNLPTYAAQVGVSFATAHWDKHYRTCGYGRTELNDFGKIYRVFGIIPSKFFKIRFCNPVKAI